MTIPNRKTLRADLVTKIKAGITTLANDAGGSAHVFAYLPKDIEGLSPLCTIWFLPWMPMLTVDEGNQMIPLEIGLWARRDGATASGIDNAGAMDVLDDLLVGLTTVLNKNYNASFISDSEPMDIDVDGILYLAEFHHVEVQWF